VDERLKRTFERIDAANSEDPNKELRDGEEHPAALLYGWRMSEWLHTLNNEPSPELQIAARAQHIRRWEIPRDTYPQNRKGYLDWRVRLYDHHAEKTLEIMQELGWDEDAQYQVNFLLHKRCLSTNRDVQYLEDCACLVFMQHGLDEFIKEQKERKALRIIQKMWAKMTEQGHIEAMKLDHSPEVAALLEQALLTH
jgi:hypothetical protein